MSSITIEPMDERPIPGNFRAQIQKSKLLLPREFADSLRRDGIRTVEDLVSYMDAFPSSVAETLRWSIGDVNLAFAKLKKQLRGRVSDTILDQRSHRNPQLGAMDPDDLS